MEDTLNIDGKIYHLTEEQQKQIEKYREDAYSEIEAAGEADIPPNTIGCAPDRFKPIVQKYQARVDELLSQ